MMFSIMSLHTEGHHRGKSKITCIARELKNPWAGVVGKR